MVLSANKRRNSKMLRRVFGVTLNGVNVDAYYADGRRGVVRSRELVAWKDTLIWTTVERRGKVGWLKRDAEAQR